MRGLNHHEDWSWSNAPRKGGGGTNTTTTQSGPPQNVLANYQQVYGQGQNVSQQPYPTYGGSMLAGFTPQQVAGFGNIDTAVNSSQPFLNQASQFATNAATSLNPENFGSTSAAYADQALNPTIANANSAIGGGMALSQSAAQGLQGANFGSTVGQYYSPYAQSVIAPTEAQFANQNAQQFNQVRGNAAAQGAFGGDREAIAEAQVAGQQQLAQAPVIAGLETQGWNQAEQAALQSAGVQQQTAGQLLGAGQQEAGLGNLQLSGYNAATQAAQGNAWLNSQGSFAMGNLGQEAQTLGLQGANAQIGAGGMQQQQAQQELAIPYQQFQAAQGYPYQITNYLEGLATGTGSLSGQQGSTSVPGPSAASQVAGLGLAGVGAYGVLNQAGAFNSVPSTAGDLSNYASSAADYSAAGMAPGFSFGATGGRILHRAPGGMVAPNIPGEGIGIGDTNVNIIPQPPPSAGASMLNTNTGSTSTGSGGGPSGIQQVQQGIGTIGSIAALAALAASGGRIDHDKLRALHSLRRDIVMPRRDYGGAVSPMMNPGAPIGSPMQSNLYQQYASLPTEKLQELAVRAPQNPMIQRAIQMRRMTPQADPSQQQQPQQAQPGLGAPQQPQPQQPQPQQMMAAPGGFAEGGEIERDYGGDIPDVDDYGRVMPEIPGMSLSSIPGLAASPSAPPSGAQNADSRLMPGFGPQDYPPPSPVGGAYADFRPTAGFGPQNYPMPSTGVPAPSSHAPHIGSSGAPVGGVGPQPTTPQQDNGAAAPQSHEGDDGGTPAHTSNFLATPSGMLLAAGLGILGGRSPFPGVNIGEGGLKGLQIGQQAQEHEQNAQLRQLQVQELGDYRKQMSLARQDQVAQSGTNAADQHQIERDQQALLKQRLDQGRYTWQPGTGPDPNDPSKQVTGMYRLPSTGDGPPQFMPGQTLTSKTSSSAVTMPPDVTQMIAQRVVAGDTSALTGLGYGSTGAQARIAVQTEIAKQLRDQGLTGADLAAKTAEYMGERAGARTEGTREATVGMAVNEAQNFMPLALQASANVSRSQFPTINSVLQAYEKGTGDENVVRLAVATNSLTNAYSRAITPSGIPTEGNQQRARELLDRAWSQGQYSTAVDQLWKEMQAAQASPIQTRNAQADRISGRNPNAGMPTQQSLSPQQTQATPNIPRLTDPSEVSKLPKGSRFIDPNGVLRTVP